MLLFSRVEGLLCWRVSQAVAKHMWINCSNFALQFTLHPWASFSVFCLLAGKAKNLDECNLPTHRNRFSFNFARNAFRPWFVWGIVWHQSNKAMAWSCSTPWQSKRYRIIPNLCCACPNASTRSEGCCQETCHKKRRRRWWWGWPLLRDNFNMHFAGLGKYSPTTKTNCEGIEAGLSLLHLYVVFLRAF